VRLDVGFSRRWRAPGSLAVVIAVGVLPGAARAATSSPAGGTETCGWRVTREYGPESLTYRLHLDVGGCQWWDGSDRSLHVTVTRRDGHGARTTRSEPSPCTRTGAAGPGEAVGCDASATLAHPEGETAHYAGQATWQWNDGRHRVAFTTRCTTTSETVSCADDRSEPPG